MGLHQGLREGSITPNLSISWTSPSTVGPLPYDGSGGSADVMLEDLGSPGEGREHIRELTDQVEKLRLLGGRQMGTDVYNHGSGGGEGHQLGTCSNPPLQ